MLLFYCHLDKISLAVLHVSDGNLELFSVVSKTVFLTVDGWGRISTGSHSCNMRSQVTRKK